MILQKLKYTSRNLYIITGVSASGKTTLATKAYKILKESVFLSVDSYKQKIYEENGFINEQERKLLNQLAKDEFKKDLIIQMRNSSPDIIVEYPFSEEWQEFFQNVASTYKYTIIIINCNTKPFDDIWTAKVKRDKDKNARPLCLTAQTYIPKELYEPKYDLNSYDVKEIHRREYIDQIYNKLKGDYLFSDIQFNEMLDKYI